MNVHELYETPSFVNMREVVEYVGGTHRDMIAYSYRIKPTDKEIKTVTYRALAKDVRALATAAIEHGFAGHRIALIGTLSYGWICSYLALLSVGCILVPLDPAWGEEELTETAKFAECHALLCSEAVRKEKGASISAVCATDTLLSLDENADVPTVFDWIKEGKDLRRAGNVSYESAPIKPDELALLVFTSGTTGKGKGVMLSQTAILSDISAGLKYIKVTDRTIGLLPPHHTFGSTVGILGNLIFGTNLYISSGLRYLPSELAEHRPGHLIVVPLYLESFQKRISDTIRKKGLEKAFTNLKRLSSVTRRVGLDLRSKLFGSVLKSFGGNLKYVICGGAPLNQSTADFFQSLGVSIINGYGITECAPLISVNRNNGTKNGSCGLIIPGISYKIADADENGDGEIRVKGTNVMMGYYKDPDATAAVFDCDGYFCTGDIGHLDENGYLYITGRIKNLIILANGKNVYPEEIEAELATVPGVIDVVVYEGVSRRGVQYNTTVAEIFPDADYLKQNGIEDSQHFYQKFVNDYNRTAVPYKKIGLLRIRQSDFPKNTLRKIVRFKIDRTID